MYTSHFPPVIPTVSLSTCLHLCFISSFGCSSFDNPFNTTNLAHMYLSVESFAGAWETYKEEDLQK